MDDGRNIAEIHVRDEETRGKDAMLVRQVRELAEAEPAAMPLLANAAAAIFETVPGLNWAGFYLRRGEELVLGPFQGKTACIHIPWGKGVCGTAAAENRSVRVPDVHAFPGHIACDSASRSELVIPLRKRGRVFGVMDLDSPEPERFSEADQEGLEAVAQVISEAIRPESVFPSDMEADGTTASGLGKTEKPEGVPSLRLEAARHLAADYLKRVVRPGDQVVDATAGNGYDTRMLAELVGPVGRVYAFDIQEQAIRVTGDRLEAAGLRERVELIHEGHQRMKEYVREPVRAATFNLGWLPGSDKTVTTQWETTREALAQALALLLPGGLCTVCAYPGHDAGETERAQLMSFLAGLRPQEYNVLHEKFLNAGPAAPECFVIQRMG